MSDTPERICDHAAAIRANLTAIKQYAHNGDVPRYAHIAEAGKHADALAADLARVVAYARMVTAFAREIDRQRGESADAAIAKMQETTGVADLMRDNDGEAR